MSNGAIWLCSTKWIYDRATIFWRFASDGNLPVDTRDRYQKTLKMASLGDVDAVFGGFVD